VEICAICLAAIDEADPPGAGLMLFHTGCCPACRFCGRTYELDEAGWDFRGGTEWSDEHGFISRLESAACPNCSDSGGRRDYGSGW
jgi:hypothetical protein